MKVKRTFEKEVKFFEMCPGMVFLSGSIPCMKTDIITTCEEDTFNAVTLETGEFVRFGGEDLVRPCYDAELIIP